MKKIITIFVFAVSFFVIPHFAFSDDDLSKSLDKKENNIKESSSKESSNNK